MLDIAPIYHMKYVAKNGHRSMWIQALEAKFENKGHSWGREDFDQVFSGYEARFPTQGG